jgi:FkbM family methyltransferase
VSVIKRLFHAVGLDIRRWPYAEFETALARYCQERRVDLVLDVGANKGQFAKALRAAGYSGRIISFEPLAEAYSELLRSSISDPQWTCVQVAAGDVTAELTMNVSDNLVSSSLLGMEATHLLAAPDSRYSGTEQVSVVRLDEWLRSNGVQFERAMLKSDTQGFEDRVIAGASGVMGDLEILALELCLAPLYTEQATADQLTALCDSLGFDPWWTSPEFVDPRNSRVLAANGAFVRRIPTDLPSSEAPTSGG